MFEEHQPGALGSGPRYMIRVTSCHAFLHFARVRKHMDMRESNAFRVQFSHVRLFSDSGNVQKRATKLATAYEA